MTRIGVVSSHPDTLSRHEADQDRKRESKSLYVTIQEAARHCGVSDKTIQRAIRAGTLPARYPRLNRCEIAESRLNSFKSGTYPDCNIG
jgi:excisionase family DNA binding protein